MSYYSLIRFLILFIHSHIGGPMRLSKTYPHPQQQQQPHQQQQQYQQPQQQQQQSSQFYQPTASYGLYFLL